MSPSRPVPIRVVNVPDVSTAEVFVDLPDIDGRPLEWVQHSGLPANPLERAVQRPRLSRYRAAWRAVSDVKRGGMVISHLPRMTAMVDRFLQSRRVERPHLAFSFNFTDLPVGRDLARMSRALAGVERFCVYSHYEADIYPRLFGLPPERFHRLMWSQPVPVTDLSAPVPDRPFVVAVGGEGRDYAGIIAAARARADLQWIVIARPSALFDYVPSNLTVRTNVPAPVTWGIAARAASVVVPLRSAETCCGHITIASTQLLGLPLITTRSLATDEYVEDMPGTSMVEPLDPDALAAAAADAIADQVAGRERALAARPLALARYDRAPWAECIADFWREFA